MKEIEAKILEIDKTAIEKKLRTLGARKVFDGAIDVRYFDTLDNYLKKKGIILRLRKKGGSGELTVKSNFLKKGGAKKADEMEVKIDFNFGKKILTTLGYTEYSRMRKRRIEYVLDCAHIEIDKIPGIPWLLEIEAQSQKAIETIARKLGFEKNDLRPWWWKDVEEYYKKK